MRVPDEVLKSVGFLAELDHADATGDEYPLRGTGFFVSIPSSKGKAFHWFVTAKQVAKELLDKEFCILVNQKGGGIIALPLDNRWWLHDRDKTADVAVMICNNEPLLDIVSIPLDLLIKQDELKSRKIGIGDEVFITGLFTYAPGRQRNMPILRHGNIAMIPGEQIETDDGYADVYLIEVRSIGGLSGSPVFVRETIKLSGERDAGDPGELHGLGRTYLLGLVHGHWDINESEINNPNAPHDPRRGVNLGIAIVVPADKIIEIINRPELKARRAEEEE